MYDESYYHFQADKSRQIVRECCPAGTKLLDSGQCNLVRIRTKSGIRTWLVTLHASDCPIKVPLLKVQNSHTSEALAVFGRHKKCFAFFKARMGVILPNLKFPYHQKLAFLSSPRLVYRLLFMRKTTFNTRSDVNFKVLLGCDSLSP